MDMNTNTLPVAVIGAGPVGLAVAAHLAERNLPFLVLEAADRAGASIREWSHVRLFSPWRYLIDRAAERLLVAAQWQRPDTEALPTGGVFLETYLEPLAAHPAIRPQTRYGAKVVAVGRRAFDKVQSQGRNDQPFELLLGTGERIVARAVVDASGTWFQPNPIGSGGIMAAGESEAAARIAYGIPDILGKSRARYEGRRVLVVGSGHSAMNGLLDLIKLADATPATKIIWAMRRDDLDKVYGGGSADALSARGALGEKVRRAVAAGLVDVVTPFRIAAIRQGTDGCRVEGDYRGEPKVVEVDEIVAATGFRPDLAMLREIRTDLDSWLEAPRTLAPMIDPNVHSCGTVRPHGARELAHPEENFYILGMKSYGRAPTFLLATGYEQVRSVAAMLAGDTAAALRVELDLPKTGVCSAPADESDRATGDLPQKERVTMTRDVIESQQASGCCGGPAPASVNTCCVQDADAKAAGKDGCGCASQLAEVKSKPAKPSACCG